MHFFFNLPILFQFSILFLSGIPVIYQPSSLHKVKRKNRLADRLVAALIGRIEARQGKELRQSQVMTTIHARNNPPVYPASQRLSSQHGQASLWTFLLSESLYSLNFIQSLLERARVHTFY